MASRVDPAFLLLPLLGSNGRRFSPKAQLLSSAAVVLRGLDGVDAALQALCDSTRVGSPVRDGDDGDAGDVAYRLNPDKVAAFLKAKALRLGGVLQAQADGEEARLRSTMGMFSSKSESVAGEQQPAGAPASTPAPAAGADGGEGTASGSSPASSGAISSAGVRAAHVATAVGILSEYLADDWTEAVAAACGCVGDGGGSAGPAQWPC